MRRFALSAALCLSPLALKAEAPSVAVDIAPVHSLVAQLMDGVGTPGLVVEQGASPHHFTLRPSQARMVQEADLVIWMGPQLTPGLESTIEALSQEAQIIDLMRQPETLKLPFRGAAIFVDDEDHDDHDGHDDGHKDHDDHAHDDHGHDETHAEHKHDDHGHDDHDDHKHDEHEHDEHANEEGHDHGHDHSHDGDDPHAWLDPENARIWIQTIADALVYQDRDNAETYRANAAKATEALDALIADVEADLAPVRGQRYLVFHDAYQYFEQRFGLTPLGAVTGGDAAPASAARLSNLAGMVKEQNIRCALSEPQFSPRLIEQAIGQGVRVVEIDPLGSTKEPGPDHYAATLGDMAEALVACTAAE